MDSYDVEYVDDDAVAALKARLAKAAAQRWGKPSPSDAWQQSDAWQRWQAAHPEPERDEVEIESTDTEEKPERRRRERKPTLASVAKQAIKAGIEVARYEVEPDGKIVVVTGKPNETNSDPDPWERAMQGPKQ